MSFGIFEPELGESWSRPCAEVLGMIAAAGYEGTELGPYGWLPTDASELDAVLRRFRLRLASSFVPLRLSDPAALESGVERVLTVGRLLSTQGVEEVIVADAGDEVRAALAGTNPAGWNDLQWEQAARCLAALATALRTELGMRVVVHHHAGTWIETPSEVDRLLAVTDPDDVGLLLDTGHWVYGGGDPLEALERHGERVRYLHLKDVNRAALAGVLRAGASWREALERGVFVPLGSGCVDLVGVARWLERSGYDGWIIVEQDALADSAGTLRPDPLESASASRSLLRSLGL